MGIFLGDWWWMHLHIGGYILIDDGGCTSMRISVLQFRMGLYFPNVIVGLPSLGPLYWLISVPLIRVVCYAGLVSYVLCFPLIKKKS